MKKPDGNQPVQIGDGSEDAREPYEPPRLECEELFEVLALACGKVQPTQATCIRLSRAS
jgi:hypothetical protein